MLASAGARRTVRSLQSVLAEMSGDGGEVCWTRLEEG